MNAMDGSNYIQLWLQLRFFIFIFYFSYDASEVKACCLSCLSLQHYTQ